MFRISLALMKAEQADLCQGDWDSTLLFLKDISQRLYDVDGILHASLKIKRHRAMERIFTTDEIREITANGGNVPKSLAPSASSESVNIRASASDFSKDKEELSEREEKPSLLRQFSNSILPKKFASSPSSPKLHSKGAQSSSSSSSGDQTSDGEQATPPVRVRSRSQGQDFPVPNSVSSPNLRIPDRGSVSVSAVDEQNLSLTPKPYLFGTPYFGSKQKKPQALQIIDSDSNGAPRTTPPPAAPRPLSSAVSMSAFDLTALEKARANASAISASHHQRFRTTLDTDAASAQRAVSSLSGPNGSQSARGPSKVTLLGLPTISEESTPAADSPGLRNSRSAPSSPRKSNSTVDRDSLSNAVADMLAATETTSAETAEGEELPAIEPQPPLEEVRPARPTKGYSDYLSAAMSLDNNIRTSIPVPFEPEEPVTSSEPDPATDGAETDKKQE